VFGALQAQPPQITIRNRHPNQCPALDQRVKLPAKCRNVFGTWFLQVQLLLRSDDYSGFESFQFSKKRKEKGNRTDVKSCGSLCSMATLKMGDAISRGGERTVGQWTMEA
jgi:hypothetical protein